MEINGIGEAFTFVCIVLFAGWVSGLLNVGGAK